MKKKTEHLKKRVMRQVKSAWDQYSTGEKKKVFAFGDKYKELLNEVKTEREMVEWLVNQVEKNGFVSSKRKGKKFYMVNRAKCLAIAITGRKPLSEGVRLIISHIDSPRLDLKPNPLYEETNLALLRTHYYGGIKKYQWTSIPLSLHGIIIKTDGKKIKINIGENLKEPAFTIADLLPHLSRKVQSEKKLSEAIEGEKLTLLAGSIPFPDEKEKMRVKLAILEMLNKRYGIKEEDFISGEIEAVPAFAARDIGFDRGLLGGYGQDDRVCAYTSFRAINEIESPEHSTLVLFVDKEEIGSAGATGAQSQFLIDCIKEIIVRKEKTSNFGRIREVINGSKALSADVNAAINPNYQTVLEKMNAAKLGFGVVLIKYTGGGGKYGTNDASAEFLSEIRYLFNKNKVIWQTGELGKVDEGGGGTVSQYIAQYGIETVDCGTPVLGMHSPFEISSKADVYETFKAYRVFLKS